MMKKNNRSRIVVNMLIAIVIGIIVNFSYFVFILLSSSQATQIPHPRYSSTLVITIDVLYSVILAFILLSIITSNVKDHQNAGNTYIKRLLICAGITFLLYFLTPFSKRNGDIIFVFFARRLFNPMLVLKSSFTFVVVALYGKIYELIYQRQNIILENEKLKNENLQSQYDVLINQINPHFFFNSLTSLAMLVRERKNEDALTYIDRISDTFRYIIQNGRNGITTLQEELKFLDAYKYLFEIRYAGKLFFDIDIDDKYRSWKLPFLSLQPLIENAVKHNAITSSVPLHISISTGKESLTISNRIAPKISNEKSTGIGLKNIASRYKLLTNKDISISNDGRTFAVKLPLIQP